jgi:hypothetical protein
VNTAKCEGAEAGEQKIFGSPTTKSKPKPPIIPKETTYVFAFSFYAGYKMRYFAISYYYIIQCPPPWIKFTLL